MENIESPTKSSFMNLSNRPNERNVLKELNNIDGATKSPKEFTASNQPVNLAKVSTSLPITEPSVVGADVNSNGGDIVVNRNLLNVTTTHFQASDDEVIEAVIESPLVTSSPAVRTESTIESMLESQTHIHSESIETVFTEELNATHTLPTDGFPSCPQDATFISTNTAINQTVLIESGSPKLENKAEGQDIIESSPVTESPIDGTKLNQTQKIDKFKSNQSVSADSLELDGDTRDSALDSSKTEEDNLSTPPDQRLSVVTAEEIFSSRKAPTFSEMFPNSTHSTNDEFDKCKTNQQWDASFVIEKTDLADEISPNKRSVNSTILLDAKDKTMLMAKNAANVVPAFEFKPPSVPILAVGKSNQQKEDTDNFMVLNPNDFEFLQSRGTNSPNPDDDPRSSLLLRFDPLARRSLQPTQQTCPGVQDRSSRSELNKTLTPSDQNISVDDRLTGELPSNGVLVNVVNDMDDDTNSYMNNVRIEKNGDKVISVDGVLLTNKKIDITSVDENIRKKMEEYEATQEILLKRITEKDKAITKTSNVLELYEKAIAEALAAKEKLSQNYEKEHEELKTDRDVTFQHLLSLESTFADLHMKFERNVQYTSQLQEKLNAITDDKSKAEDLLRQQELRYDKMKSHTMQQFDIANAKLEQQTRTISLDNTKLKAQIKREEIHKNAVAEELSQKKKQNEELSKICDELISDQRN